MILEAQPAAVGRALESCLVDIAPASIAVSLEANSYKQIPMKVLQVVEPAVTFCMLYKCPVGIYSSWKLYLHSI